MVLLKAEDIKDLTDKIFSKWMELNDCDRNQKFNKKIQWKNSCNGVELKIGESELFALLGTWCRKTTIIKMLSTLISPTDEEIRINGLNIIKDKEKIKGMLILSPQKNSYRSKSLSKRKSGIHGRNLSDTT